MVFDSIINACPWVGKAFDPLPTCPVIEDTYTAYKRVFDECKPSSEVRRLLDVIGAAQEPLTMRQLATLKMDLLLEDLPGWGCLFYLGSGHGEIRVPLQMDCLF